MVRRFFINDEELRIVMVGKTGVGKSATGNTILGKHYFKSRLSPKSLTAHCEKVFGVLDGEKLSIIDTPGLFDTRKDEADNIKEIAQCISYASPGPHIFLVVISLGRYTQEEKQTVQKIQKIFGKEADKYSMVLFTHGDQLKEQTIEDYLKDSEDLQELVSKCNGQYHVFNNNTQDQSQVKELLKKIRNIAAKNGGSHYTTEMFQAAEKVIEEEKRLILRQREEEMRKEHEELKKKIEEKYEQQIRKERADREKQLQLLAAREREMEEQIKILREAQERRARQEAEDILSKLLHIVKQFLGL